MPSDIMTSDNQVTDDQVITKTVKVFRINNSNGLGTRMWFVFQDTDGNMFQKWSLLMDDADAILAISQPGDSLEITYWVESVSDPVFQRLRTDFTRNNVLSVKQAFKVK
jgi:hypothetical protein